MLSDAHIEHIVSNLKEQGLPEAEIRKALLADDYSQELEELVTEHMSVEDSVEYIGGLDLSQQVAECAISNALSDIRLDEIRARAAAARQVMMDADEVSEA